MSSRMISIGSVIGVLVWVPAFPAPADYKAAEVKDGAGISGKVTFRGEMPNFTVTVVKDEAICCKDGVKERPSPRIDVAKDRGVKNTVVFLTEVKEGKAFPDDAPTLNQTGCSFSPHISLVKKRGKLKILNSDPVLHNVHGFLNNTDAFNLAMPNQNQVIETTLRRDGIIHLKCDAGHVWMSGYVFVIEHPYYVITKADGSFDLGDIPPGKYTLRVWHEGWEPRKEKYEEIHLDVPVELKAGEKLKLDFELTADGALEKKKG